MVSVAPTGITPEAVQEQLRARRVLCAVRDGRVRFACHLFNTEEEIDEAVAALPEPSRAIL